MRHMKKIASLVLALVMALALAVPALAADDGKITIDNAIPGTEYSIYEIFKLDDYNEAQGAYNYSVISEWAPFFETDKDGANYVTIDTNGNVSWTAGTDDAIVAEFAQKALAWAKANGVSATQGPETAPAAAEGEETSEVVFENLELGYYLVDSSRGALCSLDTAAKEVTIQEKNSKPTDTKTVTIEPQTKVGDPVQFTATIMVGAGAQNYVFHDTIVNGLAFSEATAGITVKRGDNVLTEGYTVKTTDLTDECTFEIIFNDSLALTQGEVITITYSMTLTADAISSPAKNKEEVTYGENHHSNGDDAEVPTYGFELVKTGSDNKELTGAQFSLYTGTMSDPHDAAKTVVNPDTIISFVKVTEEDGSEYYRPAMAGESGETTIEAGTIWVEGLTNGTYYLVETKQPDGYNKVDGYTEITIEDADKDATIDQGVWQSGGVHVVNNKGPELPSTGGIGTTIFYVVGGLLAAGAVILLITKRRMKVGE